MTSQNYMYLLSEISRSLISKCSVLNIVFGKVKKTLCLFDPLGGVALGGFLTFWGPLITLAAVVSAPAPFSEEYYKCTK